MAPSTCSPQTSTSFLSRKGTLKNWETVSLTDKLKRQSDDALSQYELRQLPAVAGSGQWLATQTRLELAARVSMLPKSFQRPTSQISSTSQQAGSSREGRCATPRANCALSLEFLSISVDFVILLGQTEQKEVIQEDTCCSSRMRTCSG